MGFLKKLIQLFFILITTTIIIRTIFFIIPSDVSLILIGKSGDKETIELLRKEYSIGKPLKEQLYEDIKRLYTLNFGRSIYTKESVIETIIQRLKITIKLASLAILFTFTLGTILGIIAAKYSNTIIETTILTTTSWFISFPVFISSILLLYIISIKLNLISPKNIILPSFALATREIAYLTRIVREEYIRLKKEYFFLSLKSRGLPKIKEEIHILINILPTIISYIALEFGSYMNGSVVVEVIFSIPGFGRLIYTALFRRDFPVIYGSIIIGILIFFIINTISEELVKKLTKTNRKATSY